MPRVLEEVGLREGVNKSKCENYSLIPIGWSNTNFKRFFKFELLSLGNMLYLNNSDIADKESYMYRVHDACKKNEEKNEKK